MVPKRRRDWQRVYARHDSTSLEKKCKAPDDTAGNPDRAATLDVRTEIAARSRLRRPTAVL
jgi:hypothetical protein